jgi:hypothetical protein
MFIKKNKTEPQTSEAATPPAINPEPEAVASKKHETTVIASGVHFVGNMSPAAMSIFTASLPATLRPKSI